MHHRRRLGPTLVLLVLLAACAPAGEPTWRVGEPAPQVGLGDVVQAELSRTFTPGAVVAVVVGDTLALLEAYGRVATTDSTPLTPDARFHVGGATPAVNALIAASLAVRGEVDLDRPVGDHLPSLPEPLRAPTIAQLLTHTGGLVAVPALAGHAGEATLAEAVANFSRHDRLTEPGTVYSRAPMGITLAVHALERATGRSYDELAAETVFRPLGLVRAALGSPGADATPGHAPASRAGAPVEPVPVRIDTVARIPVAGLFATAADLANLVRAYITGGTVGGAARLPDGVVAAALAPRVDPPGTGPTVTLGPDLLTGDRTEILIGGVGQGHSTLIRILPRERIGVIVLANSESGMLWRVPDFVFDRLLAGDGGERPASGPVADPGATDPVPELTPRVTPVRLPPNELVGEYWNGGEGIVLMADPELRLRSGELVLDVEWRDDRYHAVIPDGRTALVFQVLRDEAGRLYLWLENRRLALARVPPEA